LHHSKNDREQELLENATFRRDWLAKRVDQALDALGDFARPEEVHVNTLSCGEDAFVADLREPTSHSKLLDFLRSKDDVTEIHIYLFLRCVDLNPEGKTEEFEIGLGGDLIFWIELDDDGLLDTNSETPIWLTLSLDVDIYSPRSWGKNRDNRKLAAFNNPRLSSFLKRIEHELSAVFLDVDAPDYKGFVYPYGFIYFPEVDEAG
jgi:hypothetical protein